jgi:hypothetical protein
MLFGSPLKTKNVTKPGQQVVPVDDRQLISKATILDFIAKHDLPYTLALRLVRLTKSIDGNMVRRK